MTSVSSSPSSSPSALIVKTFCLTDVLANDKIKYNVNNLWKESGKPDDYYDVLYRGNTGGWIDKFVPGVQRVQLDLRSSDFAWMKEALRICVHTGKFSHIFDEELDDACKKYPKLIPPPPSPEGWFVRTDRVSLKGGKHGVGPYKDIRMIIESLVSSYAGHQCFNPDRDDVINLFLIPWIDINPMKEFRIFVYKNDITAISAQNLYSINPWLRDMPEEIKREMVSKILSHFEKEIQGKLEYIGTYTMDLALVGQSDTPYFIEPNGFGVEYAAGSSLFHWVADAEKLIDPKSIELRYVDRNE